MKKKNMPKIKSPKDTFIDKKNNFKNLKEKTFQGKQIKKQQKNSKILNKVSQEKMQKQSSSIILKKERLAELKTKNIVLLGGTKKLTELKKKLRKYIQKYENFKKLGTKKKKKIGIVISNKATKSITVAVQRRYQHPKYFKTLIKTKHYMAHDEKKICKIGDLVIVEESRPLSKKKRWRLQEIIRSYQEYQR